MATQQVGNAHGYTTKKAAEVERVRLATLYPRHNYELRIRAGGKFYIVCTTSAEANHGSKEQGR